MARHGVKKVDRWDFVIERLKFSADVYLIRSNHPGGKTKFRSVNSEFQMRLDNQDIDALKLETKKFIEAASKSTWEKWILYSVRSEPFAVDRGDTSVKLRVKWSIIERCNIGTEKERYRTLGLHGVDDGSPEVGYLREWRHEDSKNEFAGMIPFSEETVKGLEAVGAGMVLLYARLSEVLFPGKKKDPAKWLQNAAKSGALALPPIDKAASVEDRRSEASTK